MSRVQDLDSLFRQLEPASTGSEGGLRGLAVVLLSAFVVGQLVAWVYVRTHDGVSYSRTFSQALVVLTVIVSLVMQVIGDNIVAAFGLIGALAIIRFRNVLKDTRDTAFVFMTLVLGMAIGSQRLGIAAFGALFLVAVVAWLHRVSFGTRDAYDGHLTYRLDGGEEALEGLSRGVLDRYCRLSKLVTAHHTEDAIEHVLRVRLRDRRRGQDLVTDLRGLAGVADVSLVLRDDQVES